MRDDEANAVNEEQLRDESLRVLKLPINYFLNGFLLEEIKIGFILAKQISQEEIVDIVKLLRFHHAESAKILSVVE